MKQLFGWITPDRKFIETERYSHIRAINESPVLRRYVSNIDTLLESVESAASECSSLEEQGEHPEWHTYDMALDDCNYSIWESLLKSGCVRVGTMGMNMHFEGRLATLAGWKTWFDDFAESRGYRAEFEYR